MAKGMVCALRKLHSGLFGHRKKRGAQPLERARGTKEESLRRKRVEE